MNRANAVPLLAALEVPLSTNSYDLNHPSSTKHSTMPTNLPTATPASSMLDASSSGVSALAAQISTTEAEESQLSSETNTLRALISGLVVLAVVLIIGGVVLAWFYLRQRRARRAREDHERDMQASSSQPKDQPHMAQFKLSMDALKGSAPFKYGHASLTEPSAPSPSSSTTSFPFDCAECDPANPFADPLPVHGQNNASSSSTFTSPTYSHLPHSPSLSTARSVGLTGYYDNTGNALERRRRDVLSSSQPNLEKRISQPSPSTETPLNPFADEISALTASAPPSKEMEVMKCNHENDLSLVSQLLVQIPATTVYTHHCTCPHASYIHHPSNTSPCRDDDETLPAYTPSAPDMSML